MIITGLVDINETVSAHSLRREVRQYVGNVYRYHRQYIYDVVLYQYRQDQVLPAERIHDHFRIVLLEILGDAQQVKWWRLFANEGRQHRYKQNVQNTDSRIAKTNKMI